jgi:hypothetical protein
MNICNLSHWLGALAVPEASLDVIVTRKSLISTEKGIAAIQHIANSSYGLETFAFYV